MKKKNYKPKKAKLITNGGYYKMIKIKDVSLKIHEPYPLKLQLNSPEMFGIPIYITGDAVFELERLTKTTAIYKQTDFIINEKMK